MHPGGLGESFGRIFLKAMATGTHIDITDIGSINEIIRGAGKVTQDDDSLRDGELTARLSDNIRVIGG